MNGAEQALHRKYPSIHLEKSPRPRKFCIKELEASAKRRIILGWLKRPTSHYFEEQWDLVFVCGGHNLVLYCLKR